MTNDTRRRPLLRYALSALLALPVLACENNTLLPDLLQPAQVRVDTINDGGIIHPQQRLDLSLIYTSPDIRPDNRPDRIEVDIYDSSDRHIANRTLANLPSQTSDGLSIVMPDLPEGLHTLRFALYYQNRLLNREERIIFVIAGDYAIVGILFYPPFFQPGSSGLLQTHLNIPAGADPYVIWSFEGAPIAQGNISDGLNTVLIKPIMAEGVYPVRLDLYPAAPPNREDFTFTSEIFYATEIVVRNDPQPSPTDFGPDSLFLSLLHLKGNSDDSGVRGELFSIAEPIAADIGNPKLRIEQDIFGYYLDGQSGFELEDVLIPFRDDLLVPFVIALRAQFYGEQSGRTILQSASADERFQFLLAVTDEGALAITLSNGEEIVSIETEQYSLPTNRPTIIEVAVVPVDGQIDTFWYIDNRLLETISAPSSFASQFVPTPGLPPNWTRLPGSTIVGDAANGMMALVDEFGVYFRDAGGNSIDVEALHVAGVIERNSRTVYSKQFLNLAPEAAIPAELETTGLVAVTPEGLTLAPETTITLPELHLNGDQFAIAIDLTGVIDRATIEIEMVEQSGDPIPLYEVRQHEVMVIPQNAIRSLFRPLTEQFLIQLAQAEETIIINVNEQIFHSSPPPETITNDNVVITIRNDSVERDTLSVASIEITRQ